MGASGLIMKATMNGSSEQLAIKFFRGEFEKQKLTNEVSMLCSLRLSNIVTVFGAIDEEPRYGYVMEFGSNSALSGMISRFHAYSFEKNCGNK